MKYENGAMHFHISYYETQIAHPEKCKKKAGSKLPALTIMA
ncbi:hypothetical protein LT85_3196 [Collimonas arenae]|uniref:Uncharacterized protein n=1 Tax=Collimonas arenae TaxID=279058 RepID=A0A0A1FFC4_9BURK|nr:hypothetical protein [Collimonas arenae]AIY42354.1 hypothetical protein LT85_3196 [Collimonas arenae]